MNIDGNKMNNERSTTRGKGRDTSKSALQLTKTKELRIFLKKISSLLGENGLGGEEGREKNKEKRRMKQGHIYIRV